MGRKKLRAANPKWKFNFKTEWVLRWSSMRKNSNTHGYPINSGPYYWNPETKNFLKRRTSPLLKINTAFPSRNSHIFFRKRITLRDLKRELRPNRTSRKRMRKTFVRCWTSCQVMRPPTWTGRCFTCVFVFIQNISERLQSFQSFQREKNHRNGIELAKIGHSVFLTCRVKANRCFESYGTHTFFHKDFSLSL